MLVLPQHATVNLIYQDFQPISSMIPGFFESILAQSIDPRAFPVWIPLAFGLAVGLGYVIISAARRSR